MKNQKIITSVANEEVKHVVSLHLPKNRQQHQQFIAEGIRICTTLIDSGTKLVTLYATEKALPLIKNIMATSIIVSDHVMEKMSAASSPSGVLGVFAIPKSPATKELQAGLVLARIGDPGNMGTLIRSAAAMNVKTVVIIEGADPYNPKVVQSTAGTIGLVHVFQLSWDELVTAAHAQKLSLCALVVSGGKKPIDVSIAKSLLVVGSEAHGIPDEWLATCNETLTLPMPGTVESLNAAVAGSIALYLGHAPRS